MRKNAKYVLAALLMFCFAGNVSAAECSYKRQVELNDIAATIKAVYEEVEIDTGESTYYVDPETGAVDTSKIISIKNAGFNLKLLNMSENTYVVVNDVTTGNSKTYYYSDSNNGTLELGRKTADQIYTYKFEIKSTDSECPGLNLRTIDLIVPKYNNYSELEVCDKYPNYRYCQEYVTEDFEINYEEFEKGLTTHKDDVKTEAKNNKKELTLLEKIKKLYEDNKTIVLVSTSIIVVAGVATTAIIVIKRRSRLI